MALASRPSIKLSELSGRIQQAIDGVFGGQTFWIIADLTNHTFKSATNYHYFDLVEKDPSSSRIITKVSGRAWGNASVNISNFEQATGQKFKNDINILIQVSVQYSPAFGLQLNLIDIDTNFTLGQFEQQRAATLARLLKDNPDFIRKEGDRYMTKNGRLSLNKVIQHIAIISSDTSAGYQDFMHTLEYNSFKYKFKIDNYFSVVQGEANARPVIDKLVDIYTSGKDYDLVVIIRGGGAQTDFLIFENYELSRAIAKFPIPVLTGIGHQKNETIADLMAHTSTKTPTKAAEFILAINRSFEESVLNLQKLLLIKTQQLFAQHSRRLANINSSLVKDVLGLLHTHQGNLTKLSSVVTAYPKMLISGKRKDIDHLIGNLKSHQKNYFANKNSYLGHYAAVVKLMSPQNILNKGFAILKVGDKIISDVKGIEVGTELNIQLASAELKTTVISKKEQ